MGLRRLAKCVRASGDQADMAFLQGAPSGRLGLEASSGFSPVRLPRPARQGTEQADAREEGSLGHTARLSRRIAKTCEVVCVNRISTLACTGPPARTGGCPCVRYHSPRSKAKANYGEPGEVDVYSVAERKCERAILACLRAEARPVTRERLGLRCLYVHSGGGFGNALGGPAHGRPRR